MFYWWKKTGENHRPVASHCQTSAPRLSGIPTHNVSTSKRAVKMTKEYDIIIDIGYYSGEISKLYTLQNYSLCLGKTVDFL